MENKDSLIRIYTDTEIKVNLLKEELIKAGVSSFVRSDFKSGISAGFSGGVPSATDLYIKEGDLYLAEPVLKAFREINKE